MPITLRQAFVLGAGLGKRLRPLTESVPKPMIPVWNKPLLTYAFDHLRADAGTESIAVNTHHCPEAYGTAFPDGRYGDAMALTFRHEPVLLDTAGGIANLADWLPQGEESFAVYNADILTDLPLQPAMEAHARSGALVTMVLRSAGAALQVAWDAASGRVADIRNALGAGADLPRFQFTGIYLVCPAFLEYLTPGRIESVVLPFLAAIRQCQGVAGVVVDAGRWSDLGSREQYLDSSFALSQEAGFPRYGRQPGQVRVSPTAQIDPTAVVDAVSVIGAECEIGPGAVVTESILWTGCRVAAGATLHRCVVRAGRTVSGDWRDRDL